MAQGVTHSHDIQAAVIMEKEKGVGIAIVCLCAIKLPLPRAGVIVVPEEVPGFILSSFKEDDITLAVYGAAAIPLINIPLSRQGLAAECLSLVGRHEMDRFSVCARPGEKMNF